MARIGKLLVEVGHNRAECRPDLRGVLLGVARFGVKRFDRGRCVGENVAEIGRQSQGFDVGGTDIDANETIHSSRG